jgi:hypothetical protein
MTITRADEAAASPQQYRSTFELYRDGEAVLVDLMARFGGELFVAGGQEGERQTLINLGRRQVLDHILGQINKVQA